MPRLNRIRIANVSYDNKYILDQLYNMYGGEHTLFNLANGSGKSVLVQMIMQPILPCQRIHERRIESYLSKTSSPTYILLEWVLDNTVKPVYFLTGIAMCSVGQGDETGARVKYFTFTYKYESASEYDIAHTPLIRQEAGGYIYMPYDEANKTLRSVRDEVRPIRCYPRERSEDFQQELREHGIFAKEWRLLARVNNKEGGVDELFSDCKSSDALLNKWILKTIAENTDPEEKNLPELFQALFSAILEQESTISEKEMLTEFLRKADLFKDCLQALCGGLSELENNERLLCGLHAYLLRRIEETDAEKQECARMESEQRVEEQRIKYEQFSEAWHEANGFFLDCEEQYAKCQAESEAQNDRLLALKHERELIEAAGHLSEIRRAEADILALNEQLALINSGDAGQHANDVLFSLNAAYTDGINQNDARIKALDDSAASLNESLQNAKKRKEQAEKEAKDRSVELGSLKARIHDFLLFETDCQEQTGVTVRRNLADELDYRDLAAARGVLKKRIHDQSRETAGLKQRVEEAVIRKESLESETSALQDKLIGIKVEITQKQGEYEAYIRIMRGLKDIAARWKLSEQAGEAPRSLSALNERIIQNKTELSQWEAVLAARRETLSRFHSHSLHNAPEFGELLKNSNIPFITGEDYLKDLDEAAQSSLLRHNPMLPFSFLVGRADFNKAAALRPEDGIDRICPLFILEHMDQDLAAGDQSAALTEFGRAMCFYYEKSFRPDTKDAFGQALENELEQTRNRRDMWRRELENLQRDADFLESFPYGADIGPDIEQALYLLETEQGRIRKQIENNRNESAALTALTEGLRRDIAASERALTLAEDHMALFEAYLSRNADYMKMLDASRKSEGRLSELRRLTLEIGNNETEWNNELLAGEREKVKLTERKETAAKKREQLNPPREGRLLDWPIARLEDRYSEIKSQQTEKESNIRIQINASSSDRAKAQKSYGKYRHIPAEEIEEAVYDEERLEWLYKNEKHHEQILREKRDGESKAKSAYDRAEVKLDSCRSRLEEEGWKEPMQLNLIKRDYKNRFAVIRQKLDELNGKRVMLNQEREKCQADINRILRIVEDPAAGVRAPAPENGWESIDIAALSARLRQLRAENNVLRRTAVEDAQTLERLYSGKHAGIDRLLSSLHAERDVTGADYAVTLERLTVQCEQIEKNVLVLNSFLERLEDQQANLVIHAYAHGKRLHAEIKKISELSRIKLSPDKPKQQTLRISVPDELDTQAEERIRGHVAGCIADLRQKQHKDELTEKILKQTIDAQMSDREILNQTIGQNSVNISLLKVDAIQANSKLRAWESVLTDNSGGELFVSCFVLLSALMEYARSNLLITGSAKKSGATKVMLIDNPFGRTSSDHLLEALIQAAGQFGMQMICLSDLSQSSITAKFSLIYQLALRPALYSNKQYLKTNAVLKSNALYENNNLEYVSMLHEQLSLL